MSFEKKIKSTFLLLLLPFLLYGCSTSPKKVSEPSTTIPATPATKPSTPPLSNETDKSEKANKVKFVATNWNELPNWHIDNLAEAWPGLLRSCRVLSKKNPASWRSVCDKAVQLPQSPSNQLINQFFNDYFQVYSVRNEQNEHSALITGYYEPMVYGSLKKDSRYRYPVLSQPEDLLSIDLTSVYPQFGQMRLRGKLKGKTIVAYPSRQEIVNTTIDEKNVLLWLDDPVDLAFMQIQGSGRAVLPDGKIIRLNYANQNGHPFQPIGRTLVKWGELKIHEVSAQAIKTWIKQNPNRQEELLNTNPSYVFFRKVAAQIDPANPHLEPEELGPIGALGVPLTAERSIAIDPSIIPLGAPIFLSMSSPGSLNNQETWQRLVMGQDTGGAIKGVGRADFFFGFGDQAGAVAGKTKQNGRMWLIWPKDKLPAQ